jgi:hypothetical protein
MKRKTVKWVKPFTPNTIGWKGPNKNFISQDVNPENFLVAVKYAPYFTSVLLYFSGPRGSLMSALLSVEY